MQDNLSLYSLVIPKDTLKNIRDDKTFIEVLKLARIVNSLQFVIRAYKDHPADDTPLGLRQGFNAFLYCGALLTEGIKIVQESNGRFKKFQTFRLLHDLFDTNRLITFEDSKVLYTIRNKIVFHFDAEVFRDSLRNVPFGEVVFARSHTIRDEDIDYCLGDELVFSYLYQTYTKDWNASDDEIVELIEELISLAHQFIQAANSLIVDVVKTRGWVEFREKNGEKKT